MRPGTEVNAAAAPDAMVLRDKPGTVSYTGLREDSAQSKYVVLVKDAAASTADEEVYRVMNVATTVSFTRDYAVAELAPEEVKKVWDAHAKHMNRAGPTYVPKKDPSLLQGVAVDRERDVDDVVDEIANETYRSATGWGACCRALCSSRMVVSCICYVGLCLCLCVSTRTHSTAPLTHTDGWELFVSSD